MVSAKIPLLDVRAILVLSLEFTMEHLEGFVATRRTTLGDVGRRLLEVQGLIEIRRGAHIAIEEINRNGGVLGRKLQLEVRDHRGNPARGVDNILEFSAMQNVIAVLGGLHTPVAMQELKTIHQHFIHEPRR